MPTADKILSLDKLKNLSNTWKKRNLNIVFTNGCFDILHLGHIDYLEKAKEKGDKLIIGLNSDSSIKILKGNSRPINNNEFRSRMLASLEFVDAVVIFEEQTPLQLIESLSPNILIKGNDYVTENIVGSDFVLKNGGKVETIQLVEGYSTSNLIEKIKKS